MRDPSKVVIRQAPIAVSPRGFERLWLWGILYGVRVLKDLRPRRLDTNGVSDGELVQQRGDRLE
jgi:hypothetical protein